MSNIKLDLHKGEVDIGRFTVRWQSNLFVNNGLTQGVNKGLV